MDALYVSQVQSSLAFGLAGQLESGSNNRLLIFLDTEVGGFNQLSNWTNRSNAPYYSIENLSGDIQFDNGFEPDYVLAVNTAANNESYVDLYHMTTNSNNYLGSSADPNFCAYLPSGNSFNTNSGYEFQFDLAELNNPEGQISMFAMLVNDPGGPGISTTLSNQFLSPAGDGESSYGNGPVNFNLALPNPIQYVINPELVYSVEFDIVLNNSVNNEYQVALSLDGVPMDTVLVNSGEVYNYVWQNIPADSGANHVVFAEVIGTAGCRT
jgi:hypothetical protein